MDQKHMYTAIGLMSGTSLDGIDVAVLRTDGENVVEFGPSMTVPYDKPFQDQLRQFLGPHGCRAAGVSEVERDLTHRHGNAVQALMRQEGLSPGDVDLIGFHGHTLHHAPQDGVSVQIGDGALLASMLKMCVVNDFRTHDVLSGGEGAPLVPVFHRALVRAFERDKGGVALPVAVLNIGGVANVTWVGEKADDLLAFDTGPGNAPLNDWVRAHNGAGSDGQDMDRDGALARAGTVSENVLSQFLDHPYFDRTPPKSLDRQDFAVLDGDAMKGLCREDGAATLTALIVRSVVQSQGFFPALPQTWVVTGGGRHNPEIMRLLAESSGADVRTTEDFGWCGDSLEAQAFAYLAVRSRLGQAITYPGTTGVGAPQSGGVTHMPPGDA